MISSTLCLDFSKAPLRFHQSLVIVLSKLYPRFAKAAL